MRTPASKPTITVQLERDQHERIVDLAKATDRPVGYIVRLAVTSFLASPAALEAMLQSAAVLQAASPVTPSAPAAPAYDPANPTPTLRTPPKPAGGKP
jgi:hypothetical protein